MYVSNGGSELSLRICKCSQYNSDVYDNHIIKVFWIEAWNVLLTENSFVFFLYLGNVGRVALEDIMY